VRILELEIHEIRGIRDLTIRPDEANIVIWGPNGAGKSAVVDAIDFLLSGSWRVFGDGGRGGFLLASTALTLTLILMPPM
jgi:ABC-type branched-subunit amino acid transport system ATPase component